MDLDLREMLGTDRNYVLSSWLKSYAGKSRDGQGYDGRIIEFYDDYAPIVRSLLERSQVLIASLRAEADVIVAWMAVEDDCVHYVCTKPRWRRLGIAKWLVGQLEGRPVIYTHHTADSARCSLPPGWTFRRFRIWPKEIAA